MVANLNSDVIYDGTDYVVLNPAGAVSTAATNASYVTGTATNEYLTPAVARARNIVAGTAVATTSGTSIDFTGLPAWAKRITIMFAGVSTTGTSAMQVQIGTGSGIETTGYVSTGGNYNGANTTAANSSTAGFITRSILAANIISGHMVLTLVGSNLWVESHVLKFDTSNLASGSGDKTLSGTLDRVRITTAGGTDTFDAGSVNILYE